MTILIYLLMLIPIFAAVIYDLIKESRKKTRRQQLINFSAWIPFIAAALAGYCIFQFNITYGIIHYTIILVTTILLSDIVFKNVPNSLLVLFLLFSILSFIIVIPIGVLPYFSSPPISPSNYSIEKLSIDPIVSNLTRIKESIENIENKLIGESANIEELTSNLISQFDKQNEELKNLESERELVLKELDYYKTLASLSEEQAQAVIIALNRSKYIDYLVGVIIGLCTGGLFYLIQHYGLRRLHRKESTENTSK